MIGLKQTSPFRLLLLSFLFLTNTFSFSHYDFPSLIPTFTFTFINFHFLNFYSYVGVYTSLYFHIHSLSFAFVFFFSFILFHFLIFFHFNIPAFESRDWSLRTHLPSPGWQDDTLLAMRPNISRKPNIVITKSIENHS